MLLVLALTKADVILFSDNKAQDIENHFSVGCFIPSSRVWCVKAFYSSFISCFSHCQPITCRIKSICWGLFFGIDWYTFLCFRHREVLWSSKQTAEEHVSQCKGGAHKLELYGTKGMRRIMTYSMSVVAFWVFDFWFWQKKVERKGQL